MFTFNARKLLAGLVVAVAAVFPFAGSASAHELEMVLSPSYPVGGASEECWDALLEEGFRGRPGDGREALYVPAGVLAELCPSA